eukprot:Opistho-2@22385
MLGLNLCNGAARGISLRKVALPLLAVIVVALIVTCRWAPCFDADSKEGPGPSKDNREVASGSEGKCPPSGTGVCVESFGQIRLTMGVRSMRKSANTEPADDSNQRRSWYNLEESRLKLAIGSNGNAKLPSGLDRDLPLQGQRICFVTARIAGPAAPSDSVAQAVFSHAALYARRGAIVDIAYTGGFGADPSSEWIASLSAANLNLFEVPMGKASDAYGTSHMRRAYDVWQWFQERASSATYHLIVLHDLHGHGLYLLHGKASGLGLMETSIMVVAHSPSKMNDFFHARPPPEGDSGLVHYAMERASIELADCVVSSSEFQFSWMQLSGYRLSDRGAQLYTLSPLLPPAERKTEGREGVVVRSSKFAFVGKLDRASGFLLLLDALDVLVATGDVQAMPTEVLFVGTSTHMRIGGTIVDTKGHVLARRKTGEWPFTVTFNPMDTYESLSAVADMLVRDEYVYINPAIGETSSSITAEMLVGGVAMITADVSGISELFNDRDAHEKWRFERGDVLALSELMRKARVVGVTVNRPKTDQSTTEGLYVAAATAAIYGGAIRESETVASEEAVTVSIGIATRDRATLLAELMKSLSSQTQYGQDTEIVLLDVGSTVAAEVSDIVARYRPVFEKLGVALVFRRLERSVHVSIARNMILKIASGTHLILIDDDDIAAPTMIKDFAKAAQRTHADVVTGFASNFEEAPNGEKVVKRVSLSAGQVEEAMTLVHHAGKSNMMVRRSLAIAVGGCTVDMNAPPTPFVDWDLYVKLFAAGARVAVVPEASFQYRMASVRSIYYNAVGRDDVMFYAHAKRAAGMCAVYGIPPTSCTSFTVLLQLLSRPGSPGIGRLLPRGEEIS